MRSGDSDSLSVFLGAPSILTPHQQAVVERWTIWLQERSLQVVRLGRDGYSADPWPALTQLISRADGVLLLGFGQLDARCSTWRPGTGEEDSSSGWWTSPWLQVEAGMAVALGRPVLVAGDPDVAEGVFNPDVWRGQVRGTGLESPGAARDEWLDDLRRRRDLRRRTGTGR